MRRRNFLVSGAAASGGLIIGVPLASLQSLSHAATSALDDNHRQLGFFVHITEQGAIIIGSNQPEIGQGVRTALPMLVAEELDVDWNTVEVVSMPLGLVKTTDGFTWKYGSQGVGGSTGLTGNFSFMRQAGAQARHLLMQAAANRLGVAVNQCSTQSGNVICAQKNANIAYARLVRDASKLSPVDADALRLKSADQFNIVGKPQKNVDVADIVTGRARFGIDTVRPDMRFAVIARSPWLNGRVNSFDDTAARKIAGVLDVFAIEGPQPDQPYNVLASGVAVVAESTWTAIQGRAALSIDWDRGPNAYDSTEQFWSDNRQSLAGQTAGQIVVDDGEYESAMKNANHSVTRQYQVPFVSHAPLEPQNCFVHVQADRCEVVVPTQTPSSASRAAAAVTGLPRDQIVVEMTRVGGGFGRRLSNDYVTEATTISKKTGWPIKLQWSREDDIQNDFYRPAGLHELTMGLDKDLAPVAWTQRLASASKYYRRPDMPAENLWQAELYADDFPRVAISNFRLEYFHHAIGLPRGSWRAPAHTANAFVIQSFLDEVALETGQDPLTFRLSLLDSDKQRPYSNHGGPTFNPARLAKLTRFVADKIQYDTVRPAGRGVGIATHFTFGGYAAHAIEVSVHNGQLKIHRIVAAIDCGMAVNPNAVEAQLQGGTVDGISTALGLEITVKNGQVEQSNFHNYPLAKINVIPASFESYVLPFDDTPTGVGEMGLPSAAPALTNAIFAASGVRVRNLPIGDQLARATVA